MNIHYTITPSPLGPMMVAATETGVCAILFGEDADELTRDLRRRFRDATLRSDNEPDAAQPRAGDAMDARSGDLPARRWLAEALAFLASQFTEAPLARTFPLDLRATAFQQDVWNALQSIPRGQTRSYSQIASEIDRPAAVRAVGAAIGCNPLAVVVPCHRVLGKDGSLTGYHWGLDRKRTLLAVEAQA